MYKRIPAIEDLAWQPPVYEILNEPPPRITGMRYIVGSTPTGLWENKAWKIAWADNFAWHFDQPYDGWQTWVQAENEYYFYISGEWIPRPDVDTFKGTEQGQLAFWDDTLEKWVHTETNELFWDDVNKRLGIKETTPQQTLDINGDIRIQSIDPSSSDSILVETAGVVEKRDISDIIENELPVEELLTEELPTEELPTEELDLSEYATIIYVDSRTVIFQFNDTTDWIDMSGGHYVEFNHGINAEVSSEITRSGEKLLANTLKVDLNNLRIIVPYGFKFAGQIKINK